MNFYLDQQLLAYAIIGLAAVLCLIAVHFLLYIYLGLRRDHRNARREAEEAAHYLIEFSRGSAPNTTDDGTCTIATCLPLR